MSIEDRITNLITALDRNTEALNRILEASSTADSVVPAPAPEEPAPAKPAAKKAAKKAAKPDPEPAADPAIGSVVDPEPGSAPEGITKDSLAGQVRELLESEDRAAAKKAFAEIRESFGGVKLSELEPDRYEAFSAALTQAKASL